MLTAGKQDSRNRPLCFVFSIWVIIRGDIVAVHFVLQVEACPSTICLHLIHIINISKDMCIILNYKVIAIDLNCH